MQEAKSNIINIFEVLSKSTFLLQVLKSEGT